MEDWFTNGLQSWKELVKFAHKPLGINFSAPIAKGKWLKIQTLNSSSQCYQTFKAFYGFEPQHC